MKVLAFLWAFCLVCVMGLLMAFNDCRQAALAAGPGNSQQEAAPAVARPAAHPRKFRLPMVYQPVRPAGRHYLVRLPGRA